MKQIDVVAKGIHDELQIGTRKNDKVRGDKVTR
jgi:hypothetical protein